MKPLRPYKRCGRGGIQKRGKFGSRSDDGYHEAGGGKEKGISGLGGSVRREKRGKLSSVGRKKKETLKIGDR